MEVQEPAEREQGRKPMKPAPVDHARVPAALRALDQWILWKVENRNGEPTKVPYSTDGPMAKSNDPSTWAPFNAAVGVYQQGGYSGIGFVFSAPDEFCGIDLDGCRDPETGEWSDWARKIINEFATYTEMSPSGSGAKMFVRGKCPMASGKNRKLEGVESRGGKEAGIEVYDKLRYFAVTGLRLAGVAAEPQPRQELLERYCREWFPEKAMPTASAGQGDDQVVERARRYLARIPVSINGQGGHNAAFTATCVLVLGFGLSERDAYDLLTEWNTGCQPPWSEKELRHKVDSAAAQPGPRNYLRDIPQQRWASVSVPKYETPKPPPDSTTLQESAVKYLESVKNGSQKLISLGIADVDYAIGGGVEHGEVIVIAARPSHGKTCVGLQAAYSMAGEGNPVLIISEEMSRLALGKRAIQFATDVSQESWRHRDSQVLEDIDAHFAGKAPIYIVESCGTADRAAAAIRHHVHEKGVRCVVVDYGQLLSGKGSTRYEQITQTSITLRQTANEHKIAIIVLAQLNRAVESRDKFIPRMGDLRDSGQIEQDADVILFLCWPHRLDSARDSHEFFVFVGKNRSRPINQPAVACRFDPSRQMIQLEKAAQIESEYADGKSSSYGEF